MRITPRQLANLAFVTVLGLIAVTWAVADLARFRPFSEDPIHLYATVAETGGALPNSEVTYLGVQVGKVVDAMLVEDGVRLDLAVRPRGPMPAKLRADVRMKTSLGEQYVDLSPVGGDPVPPDELDGTEIPKDRTAVPPELGEVLLATDELLNAIDEDEVAIAIEGASGIVGHGEDLRRVLDGFGEFGEVMEARRAEIEQLLASSARLTSTIAANAETLERAAVSGADLASVLADNRESLRSILREAASLGTVGSDVLADIESDVDGVLAGLETSVSVLADRPRKVHEILEYTPPFVREIGLTFDDNAAWSSTQGLPIPWFPTHALPMYGDGLRLDKIYMPEVIETIEFDFRQSDGGNQPPGMILISPEEALAMSQSADDYRRIRDHIYHQLETGCRGDPESRYCPAP